MILTKKLFNFIKNIYIMKRAVLFLAFLFILGTMSAQQTVEKTLIKPVNLQGNSDILVQLDGEVNIKKWSKEYSQIEINIKAFGISDQILKSLVSAGRYDIDIEYKDNAVVLTTPDLTKSVTLRGKNLNDEVIFNVYVPEVSNVKVTEQEDMSSLNN